MGDREDSRHTRSHHLSSLSVEITQPTPTQACLQRFEMLPHPSTTTMTLPPIFSASSPPSVARPVAVGGSVGGGSFGSNVYNHNNAAAPASSSARSGGATNNYYSSIQQEMCVSPTGSLLPSAVSPSMISLPPALNSSFTLPGMVHPPSLSSPNASSGGTPHVRRRLSVGPEGGVPPIRTDPLSGSANGNGLLVHDSSGYSSLASPISRGGGGGGGGGTMQPSLGGASGAGSVSGGGVLGSCFEHVGLSYSYLCAMSPSDARAAVEYVIRGENNSTSSPTMTTEKLIQFTSELTLAFFTMRQVSIATCDGSSSGTASCRTSKGGGGGGGGGGGSGSVIAGVVSVANAADDFEYDELARSSNASSVNPVGGGATTHLTTPNGSSQNVMAVAHRGSLESQRSTSTASTFASSSLNGSSQQHATNSGSHRRSTLMSTPGTNGLRTPNGRAQLTALQQPLSAGDAAVVLDAGCPSTTTTTSSPSANACDNNSIVTGSSIGGVTSMLPPMTSLGAAVVSLSQVSNNNNNNTFQPRKPSTVGSTTLLHRTSSQEASIRTDLGLSSFNTNSDSLGGSGFHRSGSSPRHGAAPADLGSISGIERSSSSRSQLMEPTRASLQNELGQTASAPVDVENNSFFGEGDDARQTQHEEDDEQQQGEQRQSALSQPPQQPQSISTQEYVSDHTVSPRTNPLLLVPTDSGISNSVTPAEWHDDLMVDDREHNRSAFVSAVPLLARMEDTATTTSDSSHDPLQSTAAAAALTTATTHPREDSSGPRTASSSVTPSFLGHRRPTQTTACGDDMYQFMEGDDDYADGDRAHNEYKDEATSSTTTTTTTDAEQRAIAAVHNPLGYHMSAAAATAAAATTTTTDGEKDDHHEHTLDTDSERHVDCVSPMSCADQDDPSSYRLATGGGGTEGDSCGSITPMASVAPQRSAVATGFTAASSLEGNDAEGREGGGGAHTVSTTSVGVASASTSVSMLSNIAMITAHSDLRLDHRESPSFGLGGTSVSRRSSALGGCMPVGTAGFLPTWSTTSMPTNGGGNTTTGDDDAHRRSPGLGGPLSTTAPRQQRRSLIPPVLDPMGGDDVGADDLQRILGPDRLLSMRNTVHLRQFLQHQQRQQQQLEASPRTVFPHPSVGFEGGGVDALETSQTSVGSLRTQRRTVLTNSALVQSDEFGMTTVNDYIIGDRIGNGSYGTVFLGTRLADNERVAIKCIRRNHFFRRPPLPSFLANNSASASPMQTMYGVAATAGGLNVGGPAAAMPSNTATISDSSSMTPSMSPGVGIFLARQQSNLSYVNRVSGDHNTGWSSPAGGAGSHLAAHGGGGGGGGGDHNNGWSSPAGGAGSHLAAHGGGGGGGGGMGAYVTSLTEGNNHVKDDFVFLDYNILKEVAIMKQVNNKHIIRLYEAILDPAQKMVYLVMQYVGGGCVLEKIPSGAMPRYDEIRSSAAASPDPDDSFTDDLFRNGGGGGGAQSSGRHQRNEARIWSDMASSGEVVYQVLPRRDMIRYTRQIVSGLAYLHAKGILHRDIKPENILVDESKSRAYLADFGVSEICREGNRGDIGKVLIGTPYFMAPELFADDPNSKLTGAVDVWALGVTVYAMATGRLPFVGKTEVRIREEVLHAELNFPPGGVDEDIERLIRLMLKKDSATRITIEELRIYPLLVLHHHHNNQLDGSISKRGGAPPSCDDPFSTNTSTFTTPALSFAPPSGSSPHAPNPRSRLSSIMTSSSGKDTGGAGGGVSSGDKGELEPTPMPSLDIPPSVIPPQPTTTSSPHAQQHGHDNHDDDDDDWSTRRRRRSTSQGVVVDAMDHCAAHRYDGNNDHKGIPRIVPPEGSSSTDDSDSDTLQQQEQQQEDRSGLLRGGTSPSTQQDGNSHHHVNNSSPHMFDISEEQLHAAVRVLVPLYAPSMPDSMMVTPSGSPQAQSHVLHVQYL